MGLAAAVAAGTVLVVRAVLAAANFDVADPVAGALGPVWAAGMVVVALAGYLLQRRPGHPLRLRLGTGALAGLAAGLATAPLIGGLRGTDQPLFTIVRGDMTFRTEYVTRFASTWHLQDYTFRGLHAFYPPGWFWAAGRTADVLGITPWRIMKPFTIATIAVALLVAFWLWRAVLTPAGALAAAIGSSLVLSTQSWYSAYSCFVAVTGVAWLAAASVAARRGASRGRLAALALVGVVLALTYYLLFLVLLAVLVALALADRSRRRTALLRIAAIVGAIGLLTAEFWVPFLAGLAHGSATQGHFVRPEFLHVFVGLDGPPALTVLTVVAVVLLAATWAAPASQAVGSLLVATIGYQVASVTTLVLAHQQLQPHRAVTMMYAAYGAAVPVAWEALRRPVGGAVLARSGVARPWVARTLPALAVALAVPAVFALGADQGTELAAGEFSATAHQPVDLGTTDQISRFITSTTGRPASRLTVLSADEPLMIIRPYYGYVALRARYAHPQAHLPQRLAALRAAAACPDAACTTRALDHLPYGPVDALVLRRTGYGYQVDVQLDGYPEPRVFTVTFPRTAFASADWSSRRFGRYTAFVRR